MNQDVREFSVSEILFILKKHVILLVSVSVICALIGFMVSKYLIPPSYEADATMIVNAAQTEQSTTMTYDQITTAQQLVSTYAVILKSDTVLDQVVTNLGLDIHPDKLAQEITVSGVNQTEVLDVKVRNSDPKVAAYIANEITKVAPSFIIKVVKAGSVEVISQAKEKDTPVAPSVRLYTVAAFVGGLFLSILISFLIEILDNSFDSEEDITKYLGLTVIGVIPNSEVK